MGVRPSPLFVVTREAFLRLWLLWRGLRRPMAAPPLPQVSWQGWGGGLGACQCILAIGMRPLTPAFASPGVAEKVLFLPNHCPLVFWKQVEFDSVCVWLEKPLFEGLLLKKYKRFSEPLQCLKDFSLRLGGAERGARNALSSGVVGGPRTQPFSFRRRGTLTHLIAPDWVSL